MIINEVQYRATLAHLRQFEEAATNLEANAGAGKRSKLAQVELDAVRAQAEDLRNEVDEYEQLRSGTVSTFEASSPRRIGDAAREVQHRQGMDPTPSG